MRVQTNSWHYQCYIRTHDSWAGPPETTNLCKYFWRVVFGIFISTFIISVALAFGAFIGLMFYHHTFESFAILTATGLLIACFFPIAYLTEKWHDRKLANIDKEPGFLHAYLKAKKDKVCPVVTFN